MTDPNFTHLAFVLDRSGSMSRIKDATQEGFDAFIAEQRQTPGDCTVTLAQFDDAYEVVYTDRPVADVPALDLRPRGMTALLDAIGYTVTSLGERLAALPEDQRPGQVIVGIMTDGMENASREFDHPAIKAMIEQQETVYGWRFVYMGANQDAIEVGMGLGVSRESALTYAPGNAEAALRSYSASVTRGRAAAAEGADAEGVRLAAAFTDKERAATK